MATIYYLGDPVTIGPKVFTVGNTPTDPTTVSLAITAPDDITTTYTWAGGGVTRNSAGSFSWTGTASQVGLWNYVWTGTGPAGAGDVDAGTFTVQPTAESQWYTSREEVKNRLGLAPTDTSEDDQILIAVASASMAVNSWCMRFFYQLPATMAFEPEDYEICRIRDLVSVSTLKVDTTGNGTYDTTWATTDYRLEPVNTVNDMGDQEPYSLVRAMAGAGGRFGFPFVYPMSNQERVQIAGVFGWPAVPALVKQASLQLAMDFFKMKDAPFGIMGNSEYGLVRIKQNPQIQGMLQRYVSHRKVGI